MKRIKIASVILMCICMLMSMMGCDGSDNYLPGSGVPGEIADLDWGKYDELLDKSMEEKDPEKRSYLLHQAEEFLIESGLIIPLLNSQKIFMQKPYVSGVEVHGKNINIEKIKSDKAEGGAISVQLCSETERLDPVGNTTTECSCIVENTYSRLLMYNTEGQIVPDLCTSYSVSDDGCTYTFNMREGLKWSDGSPLSAKDFEYSWKRAANPENGLEFGTLFNIIKGYPDNLDVKASDDGLTFTVNLQNPCAYFTDICAFSATSPINKDQEQSAQGYKNAEGKVVNAMAWATDGPIISNGPFTVDSWKHNEYIVLKKNPYYHNADNVVTETVNMMLVNDASVAYSAYTSDSVCLANRVPTDIIDTIFDSDECHHIMQNDCTSMMFCAKAPIFEGMTKDEAATFRKAIGVAIDRQFIVDVALSKVKTPAGTYVPKGMSDGTGKTFGELNGYTYPLDEGYYEATSDIDKARDMLTSIGFKFDGDGKLEKPITIEYMFPSVTENEMVAVCIQADLAKLGINVIPTSREFMTFLGERTSRTYDSIRDSWIADYNDPYGMLYMYRTGDPGNTLHID